MLNITTVGGVDSMSVIDCGQWFILGLVGGWVIGFSMRAHAFKKAFKKHGPVPEALSEFLDKELKMFDSLSERNIAQQEMAKICEVKRRLIEDGRIGWSEMDVNDMIGRVL